MRCRVVDVRSMVVHRARSVLVSMLDELDAQVVAGGTGVAAAPVLAEGWRVRDERLPDQRVRIAIHHPRRSSDGCFVRLQIDGHAWLIPGEGPASAVLNAAYLVFLHHWVVSDRPVPQDEPSSPGIKVGSIIDPSGFEAVRLQPDDIVLDDPVGPGGALRVVLRHHPGFGFVACRMTPGLSPHVNGGGDAVSALVGVGGLWGWETAHAAATSSDAGPRDGAVSLVQRFVQRRFLAELDACESSTVPPAPEDAIKGKLLARGPRVLYDAGVERRVDLAIGEPRRCQDGGWVAPLSLGDRTCLVPGAGPASAVLNAGWVVCLHQWVYPSSAERQPADPASLLSLEEEEELADPARFAPDRIRPDDVVLTEALGAAGDLRVVVRPVGPQLVQVFVQAGGLSAQVHGGIDGVEALWQAGTGFVRLLQRGEV